MQKRLKWRFFPNNSKIKLAISCFLILQCLRWGSTVAVGCQSLVLAVNPVAKRLSRRYWILMLIASRRFCFHRRCLGSNCITQNKRLLKGIVITRSHTGGVAVCVLSQEAKNKCTATKTWNLLPSTLGATRKYLFSNYNFAQSYANRGWKNKPQLLHIFAVFYASTAKLCEVFLFFSVSCSLQTRYT